MSDKDGGQAFPVPETQWHHHVPGMSLRDYFAAAALQGMMASALPVKSNGKVLESDQDYAKLAYHLADAMLSARETHHERD